MSIEFRFLELKHYDNAPHFQRFAKVAEARRREATVLLPAGVHAQSFFDSFVDRVVSSVDTHVFLPIARFCDGEYSFYAGKVTTTCWGEQRSCLKAPGVEQLHLEALKILSDEGILCPNLNLMYAGIQSEFLEFLSSHRMPLSSYAPFYFVYALLVNPRFLESLRGRNVALISSFANKNLGNIRSVFDQLGVNSLDTIEIPTSGVAHGEFELRIMKRPDVAFVGAGIGAPLVLAALRGQKCLAIDSGFAFHLWDRTFDRYERLFLNYSSNGIEV